MGHVYNDLGRGDEALKAYRQALALDPDDAGIHLGLGNVHRDNNSWDEAIATYQKATQLDPGDATAYANLGDVFNTVGRTKDALAAYSRAVELDPADALSRGSLAGLYRRLGRLEEYEEQINIARELSAEENEYNRACLEAIAGNVEPAISLLRVAMEKHQVQREWVRRDPDLESIRDDPRFKELIGGG